MLKKIPKENMGSSNLGWLESRFHFSFAEYRNPDNMRFGVLRVLNDDIVHPESGFDMHPHNDMEIISYIIDGEITHKDSMGNAETLGRGEVQYMSAGTGVEHSEYNMSKDQDLRLLQIWILPPKKSLPTLYGSHRFTKEQRENRFLHMVSSEEGEAPIKLHQDVDIYATELESARVLNYGIDYGRQVYFVQIEGSCRVEELELNAGDAIEITEEYCIEIEALTDSHFLFIDMKQEIKS